MAGDIFPQLLSEHAALISVPLTNVLNAAFNAEVWPEPWRTETITIIPKNQSPEGLGDTRNISCTPVFSKIMEHFLLSRLKSEASVKTNQFGGLSGSSTNHYLAEAWTNIVEALDQDGGVANLLSVDFAKAFNTMQHQACLKALKAKRASDHSSLKDRKMLFRAGSALSEPRILNGGAPQGTLMGNYLFILTTDKLEEESNEEINATRQAIQQLHFERELIRSMELSVHQMTPAKRRGVVGNGLICPN